MMYGGNNNGRTKRSFIRFLKGRFVLANRKAKPDPNKTDKTLTEEPITRLLRMLFITPVSKILLKSTKDILPTINSELNNNESKGNIAVAAKSIAAGMVKHFESIDFHIA